MVLCCISGIAWAGVRACTGLCEGSTQCTAPCNYGAPALLAPCMRRKCSAARATRYAAQYCSPNCNGQQRRRRRTSVLGGIQLYVDIYIYLHCICLVACPANTYIYVYKRRNITVLVPHVCVCNVILQNKISFQTSVRFFQLEIS